MIKDFQAIFSRQFSKCQLTLPTFQLGMRLQRMSRELFREKKTNKKADYISILSGFLTFIVNIKHPHENQIDQ